MQNDQPMSDVLLDPALQEITQKYGQSVAALPAPTQECHSNGLRAQVRPSLIPDEDNILQDHELAVERSQNWTGLTRFGFNAMLASPEYKNKLRLKPDKMDRIIYFLTVPDAKSRERDRVDAQAKHQAQRWMYQEGVLYRKESRLQQPRRHVSADEVFDILTAEHLRSGHHGRDKMLKVLETKYIGYTKDELMYILDRCLVCSSKHIRGAAARRKESKQGNELESEETTLEVE